MIKDIDVSKLTGEQKGKLLLAILHNHGMKETEQVRDEHKVKVSYMGKEGIMPYYEFVEMIRELDQLYPQQRSVKFSMRVEDIEEW